MQLSFTAKLYQYFLQKYHDHGSTELKVLIFLSIIILIGINLPFLLDCSSQGSGLSIFYLWIKTLETDTGIRCCELPIN